MRSPLTRFNKGKTNTAKNGIQSSDLHQEYTFYLVFYFPSIYKTNSMFPPQKKKAMLCICMCPVSKFCVVSIKWWKGKITLKNLHHVKYLWLKQCSRTHQEDSHHLLPSEPERFQILSETTEARDTYTSIFIHLSYT